MDPTFCTMGVDCAGERYGYGLCLLAAAISICTVSAMSDGSATAAGQSMPLQTAPLSIALIRKPFFGKLRDSPTLDVIFWLRCAAQPQPTAPCFLPIDVLFSPLLVWH